MLSRSSLETQKLELMSAMSELKLQQASLERENLELRASHFNNNTIPADRRPPVPASRIRTNSTSALHNSHNNLTAGTIPKVSHYTSFWSFSFSHFSFFLVRSQTPPSTYRRQTDIQYNSLPRASYASNTTVTLQSGGGSPLATLNNGGLRASSANSSIDSNANPKQRNVAFGKQITNLQYLPYSTSKSATNICHHQLVLYQHPDSAPAIPSSSLRQNFQTQRGVSVPNLGFLVVFYFFSFTNFCLHMSRCPLKPNLSSLCVFFFSSINYVLQLFCEMFRCYIHPSNAIHFRIVYTYRNPQCLWLTWECPS